jgi:hypothetical protein
VETGFAVADEELKTAATCFPLRHALVSALVETRRCMVLYAQKGGLLLNSQKKWLFSRFRF